MSPNPVLTFGDLTTETLTLLGFAGDTGMMRTLVQQRLVANHELRALQGERQYLVAPLPSELTLIPGQRTYSLHPAFRSPIYFRVQASGAPLIEVPNGRPDLLPTATAQWNEGSVGFTLRGHSPIFQQPRADGVVVATSSASADNGRQVEVVGETSTGIELRELLTLPTAGTVVFAANRVLSVTKLGSGWQGTVTVTAADGAVLTQLAPDSGGQLYRQLTLLATPTTALTLEYQFFRFAPRLRRDTDIPVMPSPASRVLVFDTLMDLTGYSRATPVEVQRWQDQRMQIEFDLDTAYAEGQSTDAEANYITYIHR